MRTREEEWNVILEEHRPSRRPDGHAASDMWRMLSAAYGNPTLRALYPSLSTWSLTLWDADSFTDAEDHYPALSAAGGEFRVLAWPHLENICLFLTDDPEEAVEFTAGLIRAESAPTRR
ncbi:DUF6193 family natural product biosynthesis protein [Streptomyces sp. NPDC091280]|uniref:DUF6193 family natural product biosynthesis protein n=1 Tax=unclassified Streptomyces TaxID=2593676 RepID=UPI0038298D4E